MTITLITIVGLINCFNLVDGIDGLAAGVSSVSLVAMGVWFGIVGQNELMMISFILASALIVSALPTPYFPLGTADLPLLKKSGYHENTEVSGNVCQSG